MGPLVVRSQADIDTVLNLAHEAADDGVSAYPGMSYEDGIDAMYSWMTGFSDDPPLGDG
jgi:hypothetical protein